MKVTALLSAYDMEISTIMIFAVIFFLEGVFILAGNIFSIFAFWKHRAELKRTSYLLVNLAVADLLVTVDISFLVGSGIKYLTTKRVIQDDWLFIIIFTLDAFFGMASLLSLLVVALERLYAVRWPFRHRILNARSYIVTILFIWLTAAGCVFLYLETIYNYFKLGVACPLTLVLIAVSALVIIIAAYIFICRQTRRNNPEGFNERRDQQNKKLTKTLCIVTGLSIICWLPGIVLSICTYLTDDVMTTHISRLRAILLAKMFQYLNSVVDPIVYAFRMPLIKRKIVEIFSKISPKKKRSHDTSRAKELDATAQRKKKEVTLQNFETRL